MPEFCEKYVNCIVLLLHFSLGLTPFWKVISFSLHARLMQKHYPCTLPYFSQPGVSFCPSVFLSILCNLWPLIIVYIARYINLFPVKITSIGDSQLFSCFNMHQYGGLLKISLLCPSPRIFDSVGLRWCLRFCTSKSSKWC